MPARLILPNGATAAAANPKDDRIARLANVMLGMASLHDAQEFLQALAVVTGNMLGKISSIADVPGNSATYSNHVSAVIASVVKERILAERREAQAKTEIEQRIEQQPTCQ
jgi:hypothetical protein